MKVKRELIATMLLYFLIIGMTPCEGLSAAIKVSLTAIMHFRGTVTCIERFAFSVALVWSRLHGKVTPIPMGMIFPIF